MAFTILAFVARPGDISETAPSAFQSSGGATNCNPVGNLGARAGHLAGHKSPARDLAGPIKCGVQISHPAPLVCCLVLLGCALKPPTKKAQAQSHPHAHTHTPRIWLITW